MPKRALVASLEVLLRVIPALDEAISQAEGCRLVCLQVIEFVAGAGNGILYMVDDRLLDGKHIALLEGVCITFRHALRIDQKQGMLVVSGAKMKPTVSFDAYSRNVPPENRKRNPFIR